MKYAKTIAALAAVACVSASICAPAKALLSTGGPCNENAQVTVSFNGIDKDVTAVKTKLDAKIAEIKALAADQHFTKFDIQSNNYNINSNYGSYGTEPQYNYSGSIGFSIQPADKAVEFMVLLSKKGYQANVSVSSYNNGNCGQVN